MGKSTPTSLHHLTRSVYEKQHARISADDTTFNRIYGIYEGTTLGIDPAWWRGNQHLDAGCGNFGAFMLRLLHLGVGRVTGIDLGDAWIPKLTNSLLSRGIKQEMFELRPGSVLEIPFPEKSFDFVAVNGVLVHLDSMEEVERGFAEGARVCKEGGYYYTSYGPCGGALMEAIFPALQQYYKTNTVFRSFIDDIDPQLIHDTLDKVSTDHYKYTGETLDVSPFKPLFGLDFCVFLQNFIQRPTDFSNQCTPAFVESLYSKHGFSKVIRLHHYVKRTDIRKLFAPLHYDWEHPVSNALYGEGFVQYCGLRD